MKARTYYRPGRKVTDDLPLITVQLDCGCRPQFKIAPMNGEIVLCFKCNIGAMVTGRVSNALG